MAASRFPTSQHTSEQLVKSAGAIVFRLSTQEVCLVHLLPSDEHVLAKGRRNVGESRAEAALREVREETGYYCRLLPVTFKSRAPPVIETEPFGDVLRTHPNITDPFSLQIRHLGPKCDIKLIWWKHTTQSYGYEEAMQKLTFQLDREMLQRAIDTVKATYQ
ncbi:hypothetical protein BDR22DRAFT_881368 [Usnea florida]